MKRITKKTMVFILLYTLCIAMLFFSYEKIFYLDRIISWYVYYVDFPQEQKINTLSKYVEKEKSFAAYYLANIYKRKDINKAVEIAKTYLARDIDVQEDEESALMYMLLGELYFYLQDYKRSQEYYWLSLVQHQESKAIRNNYELAYYWEHKGKDVDREIVQEVFEKRAQKKQSNIPQIPKDIEEKIDSTKEFKYYLNDNTKSNAPQW